MLGQKLSSCEIQTVRYGILHKKIESMLSIVRLKVVGDVYVN